MSLYYVQKLLYRLNRDEVTRRRFETDREGLRSASVVGAADASFVEFLESITF